LEMQWALWLIALRGKQSKDMFVELRGTIDG